MVSEIERISPTMLAALICGRSQFLGPAHDQREEREQRDGQRYEQHVTHDDGLLVGIRIRGRTPRTADRSAAGSLSEPVANVAMRDFAPRPHGFVTDPSRFGYAMWVAVRTRSRRGDPRVRAWRFAARRPSVKPWET